MTGAPAGAATVTAKAADAAPVLPATSVAVAVKLWAALQRARRIAPRAAAIGGRAAQHRRAVKHLDRRCSLPPCRLVSAHWHLVILSPTVPVSGENEVMRRSRRRRRVDGHAQRR